MHTSAWNASWPQAIAHIDADAFFASVEQARNPELAGKPVITGKERNIVAAASYEAKALGIRRGVSLWDAQKICPELTVLPTDYETVSLYSKRIFEIMRRFAPTVEEYSIDEGFIDLTGTRRIHRASYEQIAHTLQRAVHEELGITVSVGLSITKVLAKTASQLHKPAGFTRISGREIENALAVIPVEDIWNIGPNTAALLRTHGMHTARAFAAAPEERIKTLLTKPGIEVWRELRGEFILPLETETKSAYQTISKCKTFTPPSSDCTYVWAQLLKNLENACMKARRYNQAPREITTLVKRADFRTFAATAHLTRASAFPRELTAVIETLFLKLFTENVSYRASGIVLGKLIPADQCQPTLFEQPITLRNVVRVYEALDALRDKYGKHAVHHAASLPAQNIQHRTKRSALPARRNRLLPGESPRRRLPLPVFETYVR